MDGVLWGVPLGRNHRPALPVSRSSSVAAWSTSSRMVPAGRRVIVRWLQVWLPSSCPPSRIIRARSGCAASQRPMPSTVTCAFAFASAATVSRTIASGPSPWNVSATASLSRGPWVMSGPAAGPRPTDPGAVPLGVGDTAPAPDAVGDTPPLVAEPVAGAAPAVPLTASEQPARAAVAAKPAIPRTLRRDGRDDVMSPTVVQDSWSRRGPHDPPGTSHDRLPDRIGGREEGGERGRRHGGAEEQPLPDVPAQLGESARGGAVLDTLRHHPQAEFVGHRDAVAHDRRGRRPREVGAEHAVELELVERQFPQVGQ